MKVVHSVLIVLALNTPYLVLASEAPMTVKGTISVDASKAKNLFDNGAIFVDTRRDSDYAAGRIPDALHLELNSAFTKENLLSEASTSDELVFYCNGPKCKRSAVASKQAVEWGFTKVYYFRDGFPAWQSAGYPVE